MTGKRFWLSVVAVWIVLMVSDWLFHGVWLQSWYQATAEYWRPVEEMNGMMWMMWVGQLIYAGAFVWIYSKGISHDNQWWQAFRYALAILFVAKVPELFGTWAVSPYPGGLMIRWLFIAVVQALTCAAVMTWTYKPMKNWNTSTATS